MRPQNSLQKNFYFKSLNSNCMTAMKSMTGLGFLKRLKICFVAKGEKEAMMAHISYCNNVLRSSSKKVNLHFQLLKIVS